MDRELIELAMKELKAGNITLYDFNEIVSICLGIANFTNNYSVHKFFTDNHVPSKTDNIGWYIYYPNSQD